MLSSVAWTVLAGSTAGCLGSLLGLGGGIFLVPFFQLVLRLPFPTAAAISLMAVIGTSVGVSSLGTGREFINTRLAIVLQLLTALGATAGGELLRFHLISNRAAEWVFGATAVVIAGVILSRLDQRNSFAGGDAAATGALGGRYYDPRRGEIVAYRVRRAPVALVVSFSAGVVSTLAGIGGGILVVPALNTWCGVPLRIAAATSTFVIGVTAVTSVIGRISSPLPDGRLPLDVTGALALAAAAVLGVLAGSRGGEWLGPRVPVRALKILLSVILLIVGAIYLVIKKGA